MTDVTITFVSESIINIANNTGISVSFHIFKLTSTGEADPLDLGTFLLVHTGENADYDFGDDTGIFRIMNEEPFFSDSNTIIIVGTIVDELEEDVREILLADDIQKILPKGYDFVTLALLSILYIGNSPYQNALYNSANIVKYGYIATAIDRCEKYLDSQGNTPQSTNKLWQ